MASNHRLRRISRNPDYVSKGKCSQWDCNERRVFVAEWDKDVVTFEGARRLAYGSTGLRRYCEKHAKAFAKRFQLEVPVASDSQR